MMIDLTHPLGVETPAFPGDPPVAVEILDSTDFPGDGATRHLNSSRLSVCTHCGTHMDAPFHFFSGGCPIDQVPLQACVGPAVLVPLRGSPSSASPLVIDAVQLQPWEAEIRAARRVVLYTGWCERWQLDDYFTDHPVLTGEAAQFLVNCGALLLGVDFPSVDRPPFPAHLVLLGNGVVIVENLTNLAALPGRGFELIALPLPLSGRDGSPVRAVAVVP